MNSTSPFITPSSRNSSTRFSKVNILRYNLLWMNSNASSLIYTYTRMRSQLAVDSLQIASSPTHFDCVRLSALFSQRESLLICFKKFTKVLFPIRSLFRGLTRGLTNLLEQFAIFYRMRSEEHTSELQSLAYLVCR